MKFILGSVFVASALALHTRAYLSVEEGALNIRHIHMVERGASGEIVGRAFANTYTIANRETEELHARGGRECTTIMACGTPGGCALMAAQTYCKHKSAQQSFQEAVKQTGANGMTSLKLIGESIGRGGPVGMIAGAVKSTTKALADAKKQKKNHPVKKNGSKPKKGLSKKAPGKPSSKGKAPGKKSSPRKKATPKRSAHKKSKRDLVSEDIIEVVNKRDFEVVERDEDMSLVRRSDYSIISVVSRDETGSIASRECEMYNGEISCA